MLLDYVDNLKHDLKRSSDEILRNAFLDKFSQFYKVKYHVSNLNNTEHTRKHDFKLFLL